MFKTVWVGARVRRLHIPSSTIRREPPISETWQTMELPPPPMAPRDHSAASQGTDCCMKCSDQQGKVDQSQIGRCLSWTN